MNSAWTRAVIVVLSLFVITIFIGQVFFTNRSDITVETAYQYEFDVEIPFEGVFMRDESLIYSSGSGVLAYECEDGSKVGQSTVIARRYKTEDDVSHKRQMESLENQINVLLNAEKLIGTDNSQLDAISAQINESHSKIIADIMSGDYSSADDRQSELLEAMCKREITLSDSADYSIRKQVLNSEISRLTAMLSGDVKNITAGGTGYFASRIDGYESEISFDSIEMMTEEKISEIIENPSKSTVFSNNAVGKLIADYRWRVAAVIDTENMFGINEGGTVTLRIGSNSNLLNADVVSVKPCGDGKAVYIFECDRLDASVVSSRTAMFKIVVNSYGGLRIPRDALRYSNGEYGTYIVRGSSLVFKKVDIIYWGDEYVICEQNSNDNYLKLYDEIVVEGKDLYDGKVVVR